MYRVALLMTLCALMTTPAQAAATAYLVSCTAGTSVTGTAIWIGTYQYGGQTFRLSFPINTVCPVSVPVQ